MKIFVKKSVNAVTSAYSNDVTIAEHAESGMFKVTQDGVTIQVAGLDTLQLFENVTLPDDYESLKYIFTPSDGFEINPAWDNIQASRAIEADPRLSDDPSYIKPHNSWVWNSTFHRWDPPVARSGDPSEVDYTWDEDNQAWVAA